MKKLSLVLVLAMVFSFMAIGTVSAANKYDSGSAEATTWAIAEGWNAVTTVGNSGSVVKKANVTDSKGGEQPAIGKYFLAISYSDTTDSDWNGWGNVYALSDALTLENGAEYTINFDVANADHSGGVSHGFNVGTMVDGAFVSKYVLWPATLGEDGVLKDSIAAVKKSGTTGFNKWANFDLTFTYDESVFTGGLVVAPFARGANWKGACTSYWDNISVVKAGTTENLIANGTFEPITYAVTDNWSAIEIPGLTANMPKDVSIAKGHLGNAAAVKMGAYEGIGSNYWNGNGKVMVVSDPVALVEGTEYTLSFFIKNPGFTDSGAVALFIGDIVNGQWAGKKEIFYSNEALVKANSRFQWAQGTWKHVTYKFTYTEAAYGANPRFAFGSRINGYGTSEQIFYVDEVSLKATGSTVELIPNGSFDGADKVTYNDEWLAGNDWYGALEYAEGNNGRFEAVVAGADKHVYNAKNDLGSTNLKGDSGLYVSYAAIANNAHCGNYNVYSPVIPFEAGKEYNISYLARLGDTGDTHLRWYVGTMANGAAKAVATYRPWVSGEVPSTGKGSYIAEINLPFTAPADTSNLRFIIQLIRSGWGTKAELAIDNFVVTDKATGEVIYSTGFGNDTITDPAVAPSAISSKLGAYSIVKDEVADGKATYKVVINTVPFGRKAVITANGEVITADTEYTSDKDVEIVVAWEDDGTDVLNELATAYEAEGEAAVFAKFNGTMPENYGFIIDAFVGKTFTDGTNEIKDGKFAAANAVDGVFGIRIAGVEAGAYSAVPYAGEVTADAIAFNIQ